MTKPFWCSHMVSIGCYSLLLFATAIAIQGKNNFQSPKIKQILDNGILIVEPCEWLGHGIGVAVYKVQDDVELFEFNAQVINIQSNKLVQLEPSGPQDSEQFDLTKFRENKEKLHIKPGVFV